MQFLRTAFWVVLAIIVMIFSFANWTPVTINLWGGLQLETKLALIVIVAFLAGSLPFWALHKATHWRLRRKLDTAERALAAVVPSAYAAPTAPLPRATTPAPTSAPDTPPTGSDPAQP
ncbi:lipopolysaccharide assembly protein LapA domain-containing protein [Sphingobium sp. SYK-6]|uniref:lipopolysaccharide assembly protein LapA domain-containing protein n=1 Tax=Sphingobium sp. (strain NBRC 103272 / SYK-6) TaxID=627192 RepID=UPI0002FEBC55|nr:LapA family protein [Sphingobium sp. SYK-6]